MAIRPLFRLRLYRLAFGVCLLGAGWLFTNHAAAAPAYNGELTLSQPGGTAFSARMAGDEWYNYTLASDGSVVQRGADGYWYYAVPGDRGLAASARRYKLDPPPAHAADARAAAGLRSRAILAPGSLPPTTLSHPERARAASSETHASVDLSAPQPLLVILVQFDGKTANNQVAKLSTQPLQWRNLLFGDSGKTLKTYYEDQSKGAFFFAPARESYGAANDGIVVVTLPYAHPDTGTTIAKANLRLARDAELAADAYVDFAAYDQNRDGSLSADELHIMIVVAGEERAFGPTSRPSVWAHRYGLSGRLDPQLPPATADGVVLSDFERGGSYTQFGELHGGRTATIGLIAHELGHDLGLPDLYDPDDDADAAGSFSLMAYGAWGAAYGEAPGTSPTALDAWSKIFLGFATPVALDPGAAGDSVALRAGGPDYTIAKVPTDDPDEYYLLENREMVGFDAGLFASGIDGGGIAVWHIDASKTRAYAANEVNEGPVKGVYLEGLREYAGDPLFHSGYRFDGYSKPGTKLHSGAATGLSMYTEDEAAPSMTMQVGRSPEVAVANVAPGDRALTFRAEPDANGTLVYALVPAGAAAPNRADLVRGRVRGALAAGRAAALAGETAAIAVGGLPADEAMDLIYVLIGANGHWGVPGRIAGIRTARPPP